MKDPFRARGRSIYDENVWIGNKCVSVFRFYEFAKFAKGVFDF